MRIALFGRPWSLGHASAPQKSAKAVARQEALSRLLRQANEMVAVLGSENAALAADSDFIRSGIDHWMEMRAGNVQVLRYWTGIRDDTMRRLGMSPA